MSRCPDVEMLEVLLRSDDRKTIKHVERCTACQAVMQLLIDRDDRDLNLGTSGCADIEVLVARREASSLSSADERALAEHTGTCEACRGLLDEA